MEHSNEKCVMVINAELPLGLIANTAGILGVTLGKLAPQIVGEDVVDQSGNSHQLYQPEFSDLIVVDFSDVAQSCKNYPEYIEKAEAVTEEEITYFGIGIYGSKKRVNKLTGDLPLLR